MSETTTVGSWTTVEPCDATLEDTVNGALGEYAADYDLPGLFAAFRTAINEALTDGVSLCGNEFIGPWLGSADAGKAIRDAYVSVDFWSIAERFDRG